MACGLQRWRRVPSEKFQEMFGEQVEMLMGIPGGGIHPVGVCEVILPCGGGGNFFDAEWND